MKLGQNLGLTSPLVLEVGHDDPSGDLHGLAFKPRSTGSDTGVASPQALFQNSKAIFL